MAEVPPPGPGAALAELTWQAALTVSPDGFAVHRVHRHGGRAVDFTLESINPAGAVTYQGDPSDLVGRRLADLLTDAEATGIPEAFRRAADGGGVQQLRTSFSSGDWTGTLDVTVTEIDADHLLATWRDVTDRAQSEALIIDAYQQAQSAWDALIDVVEIVSDPVITLLVPQADTVADRLEGFTIERVNAAAAALYGLRAATPTEPTAEASIQAGASALETLGQAVDIPGIDLEEVLAAVVTDRQPRTLRRIDLDIHGNTTSVTELHASPHGTDRIIAVLRTPNN